MPRRLFSTSCTLSLLLCIASAAMWVRSYWHEDSISTARGAGPYRCLRTKLGELHYQRAGNWPIAIWSDEDCLKLESSDLSVDSRWDDSYLRTERLTGSLGFRRLHGHFWYHGEHEDGSPAVDTVAFQVMTVPMWFFTAVTAILPISRLWSHLVRCRRRRLNLCPTCSYDLRASKNICPECGSPIPQITNNK